MTLLKMAAILIAAFSIGNWFLSEVKKSKAAGKPWYAPYLTPPGLLILLIIIVLPIILRFIK